MKTSSYRIPTKRLRRAAFTILELWISMAIGTMCLGAVGVLYVTMAKEQRTGLADAVLEQRADDLEDQLTGLIRGMSATQSATLGTANSTNSSIYQVVLLSKGSGAPQETITYNPTTKAVVYDPNIAIAGNERTLWASETNSVMLRNLYFSLLMQPGYKPDGTLLTVTMELDDDKASRRHMGTTGYVANGISRQFTVRLRGP